MINNEEDVPLGYSKPQTALGNLELTEEYGGLKSFKITVQKIEEMSEQDRAERKSTKITIEFDK